MQEAMIGCHIARMGYTRTEYKLLMEKVVERV
jgi:hypothetical protein